MEGGKHNAYNIAKGKKGKNSLGSAFECGSDRDRLEAGPSSDSNGIDNHCHFCGSQFEHNDELKRHLDERHIKSEPDSNKREDIAFLDLKNKFKKNH